MQHLKNIATVGKDARERADRLYEEAETLRRLSCEKKDAQAEAVKEAETAEKDFGNLLRACMIVQTPGADNIVEKRSLWDKTRRWNGHFGYIIVHKTETSSGRWRWAANAYFHDSRDKQTLCEPAKGTSDEATLGGMEANAVHLAQDALPTITAAGFLRAAGLDPETIRTAPPLRDGFTAEYDGRRGFTIEWEGIRVTVASVWDAVDGDLPYDERRAASEALPNEPERADFPGVEEWMAARTAWAAKVGPMVLAMVLAKMTKPMKAD